MVSVNRNLTRELDWTLIEQGFYSSPANVGPFLMIFQSPTEAPSAHCSLLGRILMLGIKRVRPPYSLFPPTSKSTSKSEQWACSTLKNNQKWPRNEQTWRNPIPMFDQFTQRHFLKPENRKSVCRLTKSIISMWT